MDDLEIEVVFHKGEFHKRPYKTKRQTIKVPLALFDRYVEARTAYLNFRQELESYFKTPKDKPMTVARNHIVREGEIIKFD
jgi:hypothetical protein